MQTGDEAGGYVLREMLPAGGMAEVWKASHIGDEQSFFAIKFLKAELAADPEVRARFVQEGETQKRLRHENIVRAFHTIQNPPALVMQFVEGGNLGQIRSDNPAFFTAANIVEISRGILKALQFAHERGVFHRDVKPQNILIENSSGKALLTDFGIALVEGGERLTRGAPFGSLAYMSPEQIMSSSVDGRSDIYSFGCVLYEMLTGVSPFAGYPDQQRAHIEAVPPAPNKRNPNAPKGFDRIVMTCLAKDTDARFSSCDEVLAQLDQVAIQGGAAKQTAGAGPSQSASGPPVSFRQPLTPPTDPPSNGNLPAVEGDVMTTRTPKQRRRPGFARALSAGVALIVAAALLLIWYMLRPEVIRLYGSSSVGDELGPVLAVAYPGSKPGVTSNSCRDAVHTYKGKEVKTKDCSGDFPFFRRRRTIEIYAPNSGVAFECLAAKTCDIGMASCRMKIEDRNTYQGLEDLFSRTSEHVIGLDGIAIVTGRNRPAIQLTVDQVRRIFCRVSNRIVYWTDLGVGGGAIVSIVRNPGSGTRDFFVEKVCQGTSLAAVPDQYQLESLELVKAVENTPGSIGFVSSTLTAGTTVVPLAVTAAVPALEPDEGNIKSERYALTRRLYLYNAPDASAEVRDLIEFATGDEGQKAAHAHNFVPLTAEARDVTIPASEPAELRRAVEGARQLDLSFHFTSGQSLAALDNFARDNIDRVRDYALKNKGAQFLVLGFTDNQRSRQPGMDNETLSMARAQAVANELEQVGIHPNFVEGFGEAMQVNPGLSEAARQENRRAEVWVK
jgi:phosphate transport system substrate-binding protein